jgi:hypothetical protein
VIRSPSPYGTPAFEPTAEAGEEYLRAYGAAVNGDGDPAVDQREQLAEQLFERQLAVAVCRVALHVADSPRLDLCWTGRGDWLAVVGVDPSIGLLGLGRSLRTRWLRSELSARSQTAVGWLALLR